MYFQKTLEESELIQRDTIETTEFTIVGRIVPQSFAISSPYGALSVNLAAIRTGVRDLGAKPEIRRSLGVDGSHIVQAGTLNTRIKLERGDRVQIEADGALTMSPWGHQAISTPEGGGNYGWYMPNEIASGARDYQRLDQQAMTELARSGWQPDYIAIRRQADLRPPTERDHDLVILGAARLGRTRLIDNLEIRTP